MPASIPGIALLSVVKKCLSSVLCFLILFNVLALTVNEVGLARECFSGSPPVVGS